jgi:regulator of sigma E protease
VTYLVYLIGFFGLGLMVFIHELGHFVAAKLNGVEVETFSLGWGPRLAGFTHKGTKYQVSWFPIGGFCKMKGEMVPGLAGGTGGTESSPVPEKGSFLAAARWRRVVIYVFGPLFNLVFALIVSAGIALVGFSYFSLDNRVILTTDYTLDAALVPTPAQDAGLKTGDRIVAVNGAKVQNFQDILEAVSAAPREKLALSVQRPQGSGFQALTLSVTPRLDKDTGSGKIGIYPWEDPVLETVSSGSAAAVAGLRHGDRLLSANDRKIENSIDLEAVLAQKPTRLVIGYQREGRQESATLVPRYGAGTARTFEMAPTYIGVGYSHREYRSPGVGLIGAVSLGAVKTWDTARLTVKGIGLLFQGINVRNAVAGPLGITKFIGDVTVSGFQQGIGAGFRSFFDFLSLLSIALFLMNLLPIPAMDGGQIVLLVVEIIRRKSVRPSIAWRLQTIGFALMIGLFVLVLLNDTLRLFGR